MLPLAILTYLLVLAWDLRADYRYWKRHKVIHHSGQAWLRAALLIPSTIMFVISHPDYNGLEWSAFGLLILVLLMEAFVWWLLFDGIYARLIGKPWWYQGEGAKLDQLNSTLSQILKISGTAVTVSIYVITYLT